ncbi:class I SAM-dependent methyltransferase [Spirosoma taeanense]|uniref:Class I SAM-dependent methyltransferase n=1 Tax=Spirosoma taeanense TaxID=2735870 RepID=A0A6M5Y7V0_9BACT|nr:class I SAM-dependent methyltransferase [Spirosoma taeanense]QJW89985.1 class I SAM-dependent methyltransferase [Spirosoma taeanense]
MSDQTAQERARMPTGCNPVLERRTVENGNRNLLKYLRPGLSVLDVGCGTGAITRSMARLVGPTGHVLGIDPNADLIAQARQQATDLPGLAFQQADIYAFDTTEQFDLVTCARTLQWLARPREALLRMKQLVKPGGYLAVLDFNHEKIRWTPEPPSAMQTFYRAFLQWRQDAGFDNAIADHLQELMTGIGLEAIRVDDQSEVAQRSDPDFNVTSRLWAEVAELRGPQLVKAGYLTEDERLRAIADYDEWIASAGESMTVYLLAVEAQRTL